MPKARILTLAAGPFGVLTPGQIINTADYPDLALHFEILDQVQLHEPPVEALAIDATPKPAASKARGGRRRVTRP